jgi:putative ABC transport system permease protein
MPRTRRLWRFWRADPIADADVELAFHLESQIAEFVDGGMSPADARDAAMRRFGDLDDISKTLHRLGHQRERGVRFTERLDRVRQDARFALRQFARQPLFTAAAVLTMALGIGANTAIFSVAYSVLLRPLPYANGDRLLALNERIDSHTMSVTFGNYGVWKRQATDFQSLAGIWYGGFTLTGAGSPQRVSAYRITADYWKTLYIPPALGGYFSAAHDRVGAPNVVVLSHAFWKSTFGGDSGIVGRAITLDGQPYTVLGVASPDYAIYSSAPSIWVPLRITERQLQEHADHELSVIGLVRSGIDTATAVAQLTRIEMGLAQQYPHAYFDGGIIARPLQSSMVASSRGLIYLLSGAVGLVLLIACVNVANLLLARGASRRKEVAIRGALGAGRRRVVGQLLVESFLLALTGGALGIAVATPILHFLVQAGPAYVPRLHDAKIDLPVLAFTVGLSVVSGLVFGLAPALRTSRLDLQRALRDGHRGSGGSVRDRLRGGLVIAEIAIALVLLDGAGLLVRSAIEMQRVQPGFNTHNLLVTGVQLPHASYPTDTVQMLTMNRIADAMAATPGVAGVTMVSLAPIAAGGWDCGYFPDRGSGAARSAGANTRIATPNFFQTMGIPLVRGRTFTSSDVAGAPPVVMINASMAHELFGTDDPIGRRLAACTDPVAGNPHWLTVVGVTGDIRANGLGSPIVNEVYQPFAQWPQPAMTFLIRTTVPVAGVVPSVRRAISGIDAALALGEIRSMDEVVSRSMASSRFNTTLFLLLGLTGLTLAAVGIYGVIAYLVVQRSHEFGVRMALGASADRVLAMVLRHGLTLGVIGVGIGSVAAFWATALVRSELNGVSARDPLTFVAVGASLVVVTLVASFLPARRATRVDPLTALREG